MVVVRIFSRLLNDVRAQVELELHLGSNLIDIVGWYRISVSQVRKIRANLEVFDTVAPNLDDFYK